MIPNVLLLHTDAVTSAKMTQYRKERHMWYHWDRKFVKGSWGINYEGICVGIPGGTRVQNLPANAGDVKDAGSIPGSGRSPGEGNDNPLHYSCLENPWTEEPSGLQSMGSQRVGHNWSNWARTCWLTKQRLPKYRMRPFPLNYASFGWCYNQHFITWVPKRIPFVENS